MTGILDNWNLGLFKSSHLPVQPICTPISNVSDEVDSIDYCLEAARLKSFENWPSPYIAPERLASAGFYYTGESDKVRCFECQVEIFQWLEGDNPMVDHQRWSGRCRFIRKIPCGNVPIGTDPSTVSPSIPRGQDVCGAYGLDYRPTATPDTEMFSMDLQRQSPAALSCYNIISCPKSTEYATYESRLESFLTWPKSSPKKERLADAGFYYIGEGDRTSCYHCGGGLKDWEPKNDPWVEHAKYFPKCSYLLLVKGREYVNKITDQCSTPPSEEETMQTNFSSTSIKVEKPETGEPEKKHEEYPGDRKPIDDLRICKICYDGELGVVFLPCGHIVACVQCAPGMKTCPLCREPIIQNVRAFFS